MWGLVSTAFSPHLHARQGVQWPEAECTGALVGRAKFKDNAISLFPVPKTSHCISTKELKKDPKRFTE